MTALLDFIPLIAFFIVSKQQGVLAGAAALLITTLAIYVIHFVRQKGKLQKQQWVTLVLTVGFCGLSLLFHDDTFLKWKSTVINSIFALALVVSVMLGKPILKLVMQNVFLLSQKAWNNLTLIWAVYFVVMAVLHYYFAFYTDNNTWINFKTWGGLPILFIFLIAQFVVLKDRLNPAMQQQITDKSRTKK